MDKFSSWGIQEKDSKPIVSIPAGNLAFASNILAVSGIIYHYRYDNTKFPFVIVLMVIHIKHFHQHPKENIYEEVGDKK